MKISKNPLKTAYESVRKTWKNFWDNDDAVGLTGLVLLILLSQGIYEKPKKPKNEFTIYEKYELKEPAQIIEQENEYIKNFKDYINNLPEEEREKIFGK